MYKCALALLRLTPSPGWVLDHYACRFRALTGFAETQKCALPWVGLVLGDPVVALNRCGSLDRFRHAVTLRGRSPLALPPDICSPVMLC